MKQVLRHSLFLSVLFLSSSALGQWGPIVRLSETDSASTPLAGHSLVLNGQHVNAVWRDFEGGSQCVAYARSVDGGQTWAPMISLGKLGYSSSYFRLLYSSGSNMLLVFDSVGNGRFRCSSDDGATWTSEETLGSRGEYCTTTDRAGNAFVVWHDWSGDTLYVKTSTDNGRTWSHRRELGYVNQWLPWNVIDAASAPYVYFVYGSHDSILVRRSTNIGMTWLDPQVAVSTSGLNCFCFCVDNSNRLHIAWMDGHTGANEVYYIRSTDYGQSWSGITRFTVSSWSNVYWLATRGDAVFVSYFNSTTNKTRRRSFDGGTTWEAESNWPGFSMLPPGYERFCEAAVGDGGRIHVAQRYYSSSPSGYAIGYYRSRDDGTTWDSVTPISLVDDLDRFVYEMALGNHDVHVLWQDYESGNYDIYYRRGIGLDGIEEGGSAKQMDMTVVARPSVVTSMTTLSYAMPSFGPVAVSIYDMDGRLVRNWHLDRTQPGEHTIAWTCQDTYGRRVGPGVYFCIVQTPARTSRCRLVVCSAR